MLNYVEPATIQEAQERKTDLVAACINIEAQLSSRHRVDSTGRRLTSSEYFSWRQLATTALAAKREEIVRLNSWIRNNPTPKFHLRDMVGEFLQDPTDANFERLSDLYDAMEAA